MLHEAFAEGPAPDDKAAIVVLDRTGEDFGCAGCVLVDEHHELLAAEGARAVGGDYGVVLPVAAAGADDYGVVVEKFVGHQHGGLHISPGVAPEVEHEGARAFEAKLIEVAEEIGIRDVGEFADLHISRGVVEHICGIDGRNGDFHADKVEVDGLGGVMALDGYVDGRAFLAAEHMEHGVGRHVGPCDVLSVDLYNAVAGEHSCLLGCASGNHLDYIKRVLDHLELDSDAIEGAFELALGGCALGRGDIDGMGVEIREDLAQGYVDDGIEGDVVDVAFLDYVEYAGELVAGAR